MCGRFALASEKKILQMLFALELEEELSPRYNITPGSRVLALRREPLLPGESVEPYLYWGLVPSWSRDRAMGRRLINARAETAAQKPAFRSAFRGRRALIPASGFYEWKKVGAGKQPHYICRRDGQLLALAAIWERWEGEEEVLESCAILTTTPNALVAPLHDRMPVILAPAVFSEWLDPATPGSRLKAFLGPSPAEELTAYPVSTRVNNPTNDDAALVEPLL